MRIYKLAVLLVTTLVVPFIHSQVTVTSFEGIDASDYSGATLGVDPNGAIGTKQYLEWANMVYQGFDKSGNPVTPVTAGDTPWRENNMPDCYGGNGNVEVLFDHLASRWIIGRRQLQTTGYFYCVAVSNTDDLTASNFAWYTYELALNPVMGTNRQGVTYFPDYPKIGTWSDGYYVTIDAEDASNGYQEAGVVACAFDRATMLTGGAMRAPQCFRVLGAEPYLSHSLEPADIDGTIAPPKGQPEYFASLQNPSKGNTTANTINEWVFSVNWTTPSKSSFVAAKITVAPYTQGCYFPNNPENTLCVPEPSTAQTGQVIDSVGDRLMQRLAYRRFLGTNPYQSWLVSGAVQVGSGAQTQTGIRWYEYRGVNGSHYGTVTRNDGNYRFMPSIAQDKTANMAVGYSISGVSTHPSIAAAYLSLQNIGAPTEITLWSGTGDEENSYHWGVYSSMTVDPVDDCTFWYVNEYFGSNQTGHQVNWQTRISNFKLPTCH